ncbi:DUF1330 domain-containing protein [Hwanghaeella grinnelliae]|uniref:DUF1330 domain-containing protein n=1 Tax=Hwanghaeella grinnelliae TaxID=2500179 RepID=A0A3S2WV17_9PROT|nr:DUF1330 domain-containing protein [Hwanghaeella grinnelliae]RVU39172.1 DUF1330 domain-containing protein [Hwanghaeella grinnelliae]
MTCYAIGHLRDVEMGEEIIAYLDRIDATLTPYQGEFIIHGGEKHHLEGLFQGDMIVIAFPDRDQAQAWYESPEYRQILPLRRRHSSGDVFLIDGVGSDHKATDILTA